MTTTLSPMQLLAQRLREDQEKKKGGGQNRAQNTGGSPLYPFWNIPEDATATVRFLPDGDTNNPFFWVEKQEITLPFTGIVGGDYPTDRPATVKIPCVDMFDGMTCPIIAHTRPWWKDDAKKDLARTYYKKKTFIFQGFVVSSPFAEENAPENPVRRFNITKSLYDIIANSLTNPEFEDLPVDFMGGRDFKISKTRKGEYANYGTSQWSFRTRPLDENEMIAIEQHGLPKLADAKGKVPDADMLAAIEAAFYESLDGKPFDHASFGSYFRAFGERGAGGGSNRGNDDAATRAAPAPAQTRAVTETVSAPAASAPAAAAAAPAGKQGAADILAKIREKTMGRQS